MNRIKKVREKNKISQAKLADFLNITQQAVSAYEKEEREPNIDTLNKIADYFNVTVDYLLGRTDTPNTVTLEGDQIPGSLRNVDVELIEMIKEAKESGLTKSELEEILEFARKIKKK